MGSPIGWLNCLMLAASTKAINLAFFFVPGQVGVFESGNVLAARLFELAADVGLALGLARRLFDLLWAAIGLLVLFGFALFPQSRARGSVEIPELP